VQVLSKNEQGAWPWLPDADSNSVSYRIDPGQSVNLEHVVVRWGGGEFNAYRTRDLWPAPKMEGAPHVYCAPARGTYPLRLTL
jgi:hypothetical protein